MIYGIRVFRPNQLATLDGNVNQHMLVTSSSGKLLGITTRNRDISLDPNFRYTNLPAALGLYMTPWGGVFPLPQVLMDEQLNSKSLRLQLAAVQTSPLGHLCLVNWHVPTMTEQIDLLT